jgi:hypothetical protein
MGEKTLTQAELDEVYQGIIAFLDENYPGQTTFLRLPSLAAAPCVADSSLDLVFIDAIHLYEDVRADIAAWLPKVSDNGVLAGDDCTPAFPGVMQAVQEAFPSRVCRIHAETGVWWVPVKRLRRKKGTERSRDHAERPGERSDPVWPSDGSGPLPGQPH